MHNRVQQGKLHTETVRLLFRTHVPLTRVARATGVGWRWLYAVRDGEIKDPGVNRIERVHDYLKAAQYRKKRGAK